MRCTPRCLRGTRLFRPNSCGHARREKSCEPEESLGPHEPLRRKGGEFLDLAFCDVFEMQDARIRGLTSYLVVDTRNRVAPTA
jgi:hypothetical protein